MFFRFSAFIRCLVPMEIVSESNLIAAVKFKFERIFWFVCFFFSNFFFTCHTEMGYFFSVVCFTEPQWQRFVLFVAMIHCNKRIFVCCTESLQQTNFCLSHWVTATKKILKIAKKWQKYIKKCFKAQKMPRSVKIT